MCRFLVFKGESDLLLSDLLLGPTHSILKQSYDCRLRPHYHRRPHNGDGFGVGYYPDPSLSLEPCLFTTTTPAWNSLNFSRMATKTMSKLCFAHVRATISGTISEQNCHPFQFKQILFMHNGHVGAWSMLKRQLTESISDRWFSIVQGNTDSEWCFALFLDSMEKLGLSPETEVGPAGFGPAILRKALLLTMQRILQFFYGVGPDEDRCCKLNFAVTDGVTVICTRYCDSKTEEATSLFLSSGSEWKKEEVQLSEEQGGEVIEEYRMHRQGKTDKMFILTSEPLTFFRDDWVTIPPSSMITIHENNRVTIQPLANQLLAHPRGGLEYYEPTVDESGGVSVGGLERKGLSLSETSTVISSELTSVFASDSSSITDASSAPSVASFCR